MLTEKIRAIHPWSRGTYGAPRIHAELRDEGVRVECKRVARLMQADGLQGISRRKAPATTIRRDKNPPALDLVERDFTAHAPNGLWVADITYGQQRCLCHACRKTRVLIPKRDSHLERFMEKALLERISLRGIARVFGVSLERGVLLLQRLAQTLPALRHTLIPAQSADILELDELHSFVNPKANKRWLWVALCRRTRQVVAYVLGDRSEATCRRLFKRIPLGYRGCATYSDFWKVYAKVFQTGRHHSVGKDSGETAHVERWNSTLRQRCSRYVRRTLSFSKVDRMHHLATKYFVWHCNLDCIINTL